MCLGPNSSDFDNTELPHIWYVYLQFIQIICVKSKYIYDLSCHVITRYLSIFHDRKLNPSVNDFAKRLREFVFE